MKLISFRGGNGVVMLAAIEVLEDSSIKTGAIGTELNLRGPGLHLIYILQWEFVMSTY